jgi:LmbE family N-acetylglucosaminyl deacetylase
MFSLDLFKETSSVHKILCLGAHCDDIEIGCGGTILKLLEKYENIILYWIVFASDSYRAYEASESANTFLINAKSKTVLINDFKDGFLPYTGNEIKQYFEQLKNSFSPDIIFTHYRHDLHQDHRFISELTWSTFRDHLILEYEIPKYDGDLGKPNLFVKLDESICCEKIKFIMKYFKSQSQKQWFDKHIFLSMLRLRGMESNSPGKYAEAFYCRKMVLD